MTMKKIRHTIIPAAYLVLKQKDSILMIRRFNTGYEDGNYSLIAGHLDPGESFTHALIREAQEEANIRLQEHDLKTVHIMHRKSGNGEERIDIFFQANLWQGELKNLEPHKCDDMRWFAPEKFPSNTIGHVLFALQQIALGNFYSEFGW